MSCIKCGKLATNSDYCSLCYHCGSVGCLKCDSEIIKNCISCGNHNKKIAEKPRALKLIELLKSDPFNRNRRIIYVVIGNTYLGEKDYENAFVWNKKAANIGDPSAQYYVGNIYFYGYKEVGNTSNYVEALRWFTLAAENGIREAFYFLGKMYRDGLGVAEDPYRSSTFFTLGIFKGDIKCEKEIIKAFENDYYGFHMKETVVIKSSDLKDTVSI